MAVTPADGDVFARSTARTYLSDPLPKATLDTLTAAAFSAPTAGGCAAEDAAGSKRT